MDQNICHVFTFFSNFLPAVQSEHNWNYCTFGTIDGIDVVNGPDLAAKLRLQKNSLQE